MLDNNTPINCLYSVGIHCTESSAKVETSITKIESSGRVKTSKMHFVSVRLIERETCKIRSLVKMLRLSN